MIAAASVAFAIYASNSDLIDDLYDAIASIAVKSLAAVKFAIFFSIRENFAKRKRVSGREADVVADAKLTEPPAWDRDKSSSKLSSTLVR